MNSHSRRCARGGVDATDRELYIIATDLMKGIADSDGRDITARGLSLDLTSRLDVLFESTFGRPARRSEVARLVHTVGEYLADHPSSRSRLDRPP